MNEYFVLGLFGLYVVVVSLFGILSGACDASLSLVRRTWGRIRGLAIYFCVHVALPLVVGVVFVGLGIVHFTPVGADVVQNGASAPRLEINWQSIQELKRSADQDARPAPVFVMPLCA